MPNNSASDANQRRGATKMNPVDTVPAPGEKTTVLKGGRSSTSCSECQRRKQKASSPTNC
jgi:hypothetical protein